MPRKSNTKIQKALRHKNVLGAGARARRKARLTPDEEYAAIMREFKRGTLHSGSGKIVKNPKQAVAIAASENERNK